MISECCVGQVASNYFRPEGRGYTPDHPERLSTITTVLEGRKYLQFPYYIKVLLYPVVDALDIAFVSINRRGQLDLISLHNL